MWLLIFLYPVRDWEGACLVLFWGGFFCFVLMRFSPQLFDFHLNVPWRTHLLSDFHLVLCRYHLNLPLPSSLRASLSFAVSISWKGCEFFSSLRPELMVGMQKLTKTKSVPGTVLSALQILTHLILTSYEVGTVLSPCYRWGKGAGN